MKTSINPYVTVKRGFKWHWYQSILLALVRMKWGFCRFQDSFFFFPLIKTKTQQKTHRPIETSRTEPIFQEILLQFTFPCHFRTLIGRAKTKLTLLNFSALTQWNHTQGWQMSGSSIHREVKQTGVCYPPSFRRTKSSSCVGILGCLNTSRALEIQR